MKRALAPLFALLAIGLAVLWVARHRVIRKVDTFLESRGLAAAAPPPPPSGPPGTFDVRARAAGPHPRIFLTPARLASIEAQKSAGTATWKALLNQCQKVRAETITSGYEAWDWANQALALAICAKVTKDPGYAATGVRYFTALLDDKERVGDGAGGDLIVRHDDGYSIRTHGALGAIAYDWLHDAPGMTPALRKKAMDRFAAWTAWFKEKGYNHDFPISNYYTGYFGAVAFAGIACEGDDPRADALRMQTQAMWNSEIVPAYRDKLPGGDFPEGWQYGDMVGALLAIYADAEDRRVPVHGGPPPPLLIEELPWLRQAVHLRAMALLPDGKHTYDNGDWSNKPAVAPPHLLFALATVLPPNDLETRQAAFLARQALDDSTEAWEWLQVVGGDPARPVEDPRKGALSYLSRGTATVFARSSFAPTSLWFSLTCERSLSDHEHLDAGHFEIVRGSDPVLIDGGGYGAYSSLSHNVVIVDDPLQSSDWDTSKAHNDIITYKRNQGVSSDTASIARFEDAGGYVYGLGDYASAFNPHGWPARRDRAVTRAEREVIFSRTPVDGAGTETGRVVVYDRFTLSDPRFTTTFILHGGPAPRVTGPLASFTSGGSTAWVTTLLPKGASSGLVDETNNKESDDRHFFTNTPPEGATSFRYEVPSPASPASTERRFLHAIVVGARGGRAPSPVGISGDQVDGAAIDGEAYVFSSVGPATRAMPLAYRAPLSAGRHIVGDLAPSAAYSVTATPDGDGCKVALAPAASAAARVSASASGTLTLDLAGCTLH